MEEGVVTAATGALGPVLVKLTDLLTDEDNLPEGTQTDIDFITTQLKPVHSLLLKLWERDDLYAECKDWMMEARDLSYAMEDYIDNFKLGLKRGHISKVQQKSTFKMLKIQVQELVQRCCEKWKDPETMSTNCSNPTFDPRARFLHKHASELVEIEEKKDELIKLLDNHGAVCIVGFAGMGKTTLADMVYHAIEKTFECRVFVSLSPTPNMMEVFKTIITDVGSTIADTDVSDEQLSDNIRKFLEEKRYLVVLDDIWNCQEMELIIKSLPKNNRRSRIIITTRVNAVAEKCRMGNDTFVYAIAGLSSDAAEALSKRIMQESGHAFINQSGKDSPCYSIAKMSGGIPLAVICLSSALVEQLPHLNPSTREQERFEVALSQALEGFLSISCMRPLVESLHLGYHCLPLHLKTCLLLCSIYPPRRRFERDDVTGIWIAERFVYEEEKARSHFYNLVDQGYIWPVESRRTEVQKYEVNDMILAFLKCQSQKYNFVVSVGYFSKISSMYDRPIHRVSIQRGLSSSDNKMLHLSHTRSVAYFGRADSVPFERIKHLRVLLVDERCSLENGNSGDDVANSGDDDLNLGTNNQENRSDFFFPRPWQPIRKHREIPVLKQKIGSEITVLPSEIEALQYLEILNISSTMNRQLPREIGKLHLLKSLNISNTKVKELPWEIEELQHLKTLDMSNTMVTHLPSAIWKLQLLKTLNISNTNVKVVPKEISKLQHLEALDISNTAIAELSSGIQELQLLKTLNSSYTKVTELPREIGKLQCLETLDISNTAIAGLPSDIQELRLLKTLDSSHTKVTELPREIGKLQCLEILDISNTAIAELPSEIWELLLMKILDLSNTKVTKLQREIGNLQNLMTMNISNTKVTELPKEIWELKSLQTLNVSNSNVKELPWEASRLSNSVVVLVRDKDSHQGVKLPRLPDMSDSDLSSFVEECREDLSITLFGRSGENWEPLSFARFKVARRHMSVPNWVKYHLRSISTLDIRLWKLDDNLEFLSLMPYLRTLVVQIELLPRKRIVIEGGGFPMLESFYLDCRLPWVTFEQKAMPKLKHLEFKFYSGLATEDPVGIHHLLQLQRVVFLCSQWYRSDAPGLSAIINKVRKEAEKHQNQITLCINNSPKQVIGGRKMSADGSEETCINGAGSSGARVIKTSLLPGADTDNNGNIIPVKSYYPFGLTE